MLLNYNYFLITIIGLALHYFIFFLLFKIKKIGIYLVLFFTTVPYLCFEISLFVFGYKLNRAIIASLLENELEMVLYFINFKIILFSIFYCLIMFFILKKIKFNKKINNICFSISSIIVIITIIFTVIVKNKIYLISHPIIDIFDSLRIKKTLDGLNSTKKLIFMDNANKLKELFDYKDLENINIVLIIGESARSDFFNKYNTVTKTNNTINLIRSKSSYFFTREAVPEILTLTVDNKNYSLVDIMNSLNFNTFWIGAQSINGSMDSPYSNFALKSKNRIYKESNRNIKYDFELLKYLDSVIKNTGKNFYIIHQIGSHTPFYKRFEKKSAKFKNYCKSKDMLLCSETEIYNSYANSIIYTDKFLNEIINRFKNKKNTLLLYTSDHSTDAIYINQNEDRLIVPALIWLNGELVNKKDIIEKNIQKYSFSHKKIIDSLLGCINVKSKLLNNKNNICSNKYE